MHKSELCYDDDGGIYLAFTLKNFINDSGFSGLRLLTCHDKLDTPISGVNVIDNPDVTQWIKSGELVLTTGYFFASDPNLQRSVIINLKAAGCSALCIKLQRFFSGVPESIARAAEQAGLPLIDIPLEYSLSDITRTVHDLLDLSDIQKIQQEQIFFTSLLNTFQTDRPLQNCLRLLSDYLSASLFIVNDRLQCLFFHLRPSDVGLFDSTDTLDIRSESGGNKPFAADFIHKISVTMNGIRKEVTLIPFQDQLHFLCVPIGEQPIPLELVERSMMLFRFPEEQLLRTPSNFSDYYSDFFHFLLSEENKRKTDIDKICTYYGYPHCKSQLCVLFSLRSHEDGNRLQLPVAFLKETLNRLSCKPDSFFLASYHRQICLFLFGDGEKAYRTASDCVKQFREKYQAAFIVGISQPVSGDRQFAAAYQQAAFLLTLADVFPQKDTFFFKDHLIFWNIRELAPESKRKIYQETVAPLVAYDQKNNSNLTETLIRYYDSVFNSSLAAKELFVHRNTFLKRISKISELISLDMNNINNLISVYYGICIYLLGEY